MMQAEHVLVKRQQLVKNVPLVSVDILAYQNRVLKVAQNVSALEGLVTVDRLDTAGHNWSCQEGDKLQSAGVTVSLQ